MTRGSSDPWISLNTFGPGVSYQSKRRMRYTDALLLGWLLLLPRVVALKYDSEQVAWNLNTNPTASNPLDYSGEWEQHAFHPSPPNWRMPFYTVMLDRFVNGNPSNDDANGTQFEHDITQTQLRHGGDIQGLQDSLDYLQGMGIKVSCYTPCAESHVAHRL